MNPPFYSPPSHDAYHPPPLQNYSSTFDPHEQHPPPLQLSIPPPLSNPSDATYTPTANTASVPMQTPQRGRRKKIDPNTPAGMTQQQPSSMTPIVPNPNFKPVRDVNIKTKFPVARIKRIMQADEDVGKVAQVTPVIVSKALELFMISLCDKATEQARLRSSKRITAAHLKRAIAIEEKFDFLAEIISKVPDAAAETKTEEGGEDGEEGAAPKRRKTGGRGRKKEES